MLMAVGLLRRSCGGTRDHTHSAFGTVLFGLLLLAFSFVCLRRFGWGAFTVFVARLWVPLGVASLALACCLLSPTSLAFALHASVHAVLVSACLLLTLFLFSLSLFV